MTMKRIRVVAALAVIALAFLPARAQAALRVVATIETLADLAREIGGDRVDVQALSRGYQDPHTISAKPSLVLALNRADALVYVGLDLEIGWLPPLVQQSRNSKIQTAQPGNIDCSTAIAPRDVPNVAADRMRAMGDVHPLGNPHYWIPPTNALAIARLLARRFAALDSGGTGAFAARLQSFEARLQKKNVELTKRAAPLRGQKVVTYHKSWSYVTAWLNLEEVGTIEPKPGIPPTANHTAQLIALMKRQKVGLIVVETFHPTSVANIVGRETGARVASVPTDVGANPSIRTYFELLDAVLRALTGNK